MSATGSTPYYDQGSASQMPKPRISNSSWGINEQSTTEIRKAFNHLNADAPAFMSQEIALNHGEDNASLSPEQDEKEGTVNGGRRRAKMRRSSSRQNSAAGSEDSDALHASKQSKFIQKVYEMASCSDNQHALGFSDDGLALEIRHVPAVAPILGQYFKHSNPSSFIRQLNNYGFKTISSTSLGTNKHVFAHPHFRRDDASLLETITRKTAVCVKKKSKGEIIRELQSKNEEQQLHLQQMEMHHLEMFQRIMALEAENKQLRCHMETMRRSFQETSNRIDSMVQGVEANSVANLAAASAAPSVSYPTRFRGVMPAAHPQMPPPPPMFDGMGPPFFQSVDMNQGAYPLTMDAQHDRDGINLHDPFHLD